VSVGTIRLSGTRRVPRTFRVQSADSAAAPKPSIANAAAAAAAGVAVVPGSAVDGAPTVAMGGGARWARVASAAKRPGFRDAADRVGNHGAA